MAEVIQKYESTLRMEFRANNSLESVTECLLCGKYRFTILYNIRNKYIIKCSNCGLVSSYPLPDENEIKKLYNGNAYFKTNYFNIDDEYYSTNHYHQFIRIAEFGRKSIPKKGKILEIGPGKGLFLKVCKESGIVAEGLETSEKIALEAQRIGKCPVLLGTIEKNDLLDGSYDMVAAFDVIEHSLNPVMFMESIKRILRKDGLLALSTMNINNLLEKIGRILYKIGFKYGIEKLYPDYHLFYFSCDSLKYLLSKTGFHIINIQQENYETRKASSKLIIRIFMKIIYYYHDLMGDKTNQYVIAVKL